MIPDFSLEARKSRCTLALIIHTLTFTNHYPSSVIFIAEFLYDGGQRLKSILVMIKKTTLLKTLLGIILLCLIAYVGLLNNWYGSLTLNARAHEQALSALLSDEQISVNSDQWITFSPTHSKPTTALVLYPGAFCDPKAYAPIMRDIALQGFITIIAPMPSNMAILNSAAILPIQAAHPAIKKWALAGHSIGGGAALVLLNQHPDAVDGLMMWDSYTFAASPANHLRLPITTLYGTNHHQPDRPEIFEQAKTFMPDHVNYIAINGGDHYQFGFFNSDDISEMNTATISYAEQHRQIVTASINFLNALP